MTEQQARAIEAQLNGFLPGCKIEAYSMEEPNYKTKQFDVTWRVSVYIDEMLVAIVRSKEHFNALLSMCASYYKERREIEEISSGESEQL